MAAFPCILAKFGIFMVGGRRVQQKTHTHKKRYPPARVKKFNTRAFLKISIYKKGAKKYAHHAQRLSIKRGLKVSHKVCPKKAQKNN